MNHNQTKTEQAFQKAKLVKVVKNKKKGKNGRKKEKRVCILLVSFFFCFEGFLWETLNSPFLFKRKAHEKNGIYCQWYDSTFDGEIEGEKIHFQTAEHYSEKNLICKLDSLKSQNPKILK